MECFFRKEVPVGHSEPYHHRCGRTLPAFLILVLLAIAWYVFQTSTPKRRQLMEEEIVATLFDQIHQSHGEEVSVEIPALWVRVENSVPVANTNNRFNPKLSAVHRKETRLCSSGRNKGDFFFGIGPCIELEG
jgi:hypothetical protein